MEKNCKKAFTRLLGRYLPMIQIYSKYANFDESYGEGEVKFTHYIKISINTGSLKAGLRLSVGLGELEVCSVKLDVDLSTQIQFISILKQYLEICNPLNST